MKVSLKWLREYVEVPDNTRAFCDRLDLTGTGVESVEKLGETFDAVVTGQIVSKEQHPDSDHLWVTQVDVGEHNLDESGKNVPLQIVCGAQNFQAGDRVVVAMVGAVLPGDFKIKKSKLRGIASHGMNCSARELGLGQEHDGIMILPEDAPLGVPFADYMQSDDTVLDLEITPNRPDCLSMIGMAREVGAMYGKEVVYPTRQLIEGEEKAEDLLKLTITDDARCPRYTARVIRGVKVGPSPDWLVERIQAAGARSINNIVDATNYILFELGQPLHAFDYDNLDIQEGDKAHVIIRPAEEGEKFTTLDGEDRVLTSDMTVIATPERAVCLAGVMGGLDSEVTESTTTVLLEAATFSTAHTSRTSRNLGLISESSLRYERGVDDNALALNSAMAAALIAEVSGGVVCEGIVDEWPVHTEPVQLQFRIDRFCALIGAVIPTDYIQDVLTRLGCTVSSSDEEGILSVDAPTFRPDLEREVDLYEEVLRLYGMDQIPATLPGGRGRIGVRSTEEKKTSIIHGSLRSSGLNETITYSFSEPRDIEEFRMPTERDSKAVELINPLNSDQSIMRQSIIPGLLRSVAYNQSRGVKNIQLYEIGMTFFGHEGKKQPKEKQKLAGVLAGALHNKGWNTPDIPFDFFDGKGALENLCRELAVPKLRFKALDATDAPFLQPGRAAEVLSGGSVLGWMGEIHPLTAEKYEAASPVIAFELDATALVNVSQPARASADIPVYPAVQMDVAFVVDEEITHEKLMQCMSSAGGKLLESASLFDVYRDEKRVGPNKKSMAYALTYRAEDRTLTSEEVEKSHERLVKKVSGATGAEVRA